MNVKMSTYASAAVCGAALWLVACQPLDPGDAGGTGGGSSGTGGGSGSTGTPVQVRPTTNTTAIPSGAMGCTGSSQGAKGDLDAINTPVSAPGASVTGLTLRYEMGSYFGEPTRRAVVAWNGTGSLSSLLWLAEVHDRQGRQYVTAAGKRVFASFAGGAIPGPGGTFGTDSTGSPGWWETFVTWDDAALATANEVDADAAKDIYRSCFTLANVRLVKLNGQQALQP